MEDICALFEEYLFIVFSFHGVADGVTEDTDATVDAAVIEEEDGVVAGKMRQPLLFIV